VRLEDQLCGACRCHYGIFFYSKVKKLLQNPKVNPNCQDKHNQTPFYIACKKGYTDIVKLLLSDDRVDINKANKSNRTPFYIACKKGHIKIVKLLLNDQRVDNINQEESDGWKL